MFCQARDDIYSLEIGLYLDGELLRSQGTMRADGQALGAGESLSFEILRQDLPADLEGKELTFSLYACDEQGGRTSVVSRKPLEADFGSTYGYSLSGGFSEGFRLDALD